MKRRAILAIASVLILICLMLSLGACTTQPTPATPASTAPGAAEPKTLKAGLILALNWPIGVGWVKGIQLDTEDVNKEGGLLVGGEKYIIEVIVDDHKMDPGLVKTAVEKEVHQDKVDVIISDSWSVPIFAVSEPNKVIVIASPNTTEIYSPDNKYTFQGFISDTNFVAFVGWAAEYFKDKKSIVGIFPDRLDGHSYSDLYEQAADAYGLTWLPPIFYPPTATDLSAVGTKVKSLNPDMFISHGGGPDKDSEVVKAIYNAGCRAQNVDASTTKAKDILLIAGPEALEGTVSMAFDTEFDPPLTSWGKEFKAAYEAKYGDPGMMELCGEWFMWKTGLQKAGSIDPDKVAAVIGSGMEWNSPFFSSAKMIARPDLGNNRTVDVAFGLAVKQIVDGKIKVIDQMTPEKVEKYCAKIYGY